ncbi:MAG: hypothetical protein Satyrvirus8_17 [Satyrvirus sp.]|uniref:Uncharacterized protein n=1 Tax=Satyrvirus sp. TaxID=2487771 RepID=A0A3G5AIM0_9VIRU|nr:MAG: hypothetical protein Satyrvirus8_17 [Satyrvirus sp.]
MSTIMIRCECKNYPQCGHREELVREETSPCIKCSRPTNQLGGVCRLCSYILDDGKKICYTKGCGRPRWPEDLLCDLCSDFGQTAPKRLAEIQKPDIKTSPDRLCKVCQLVSTSKMGRICRSCRKIKNQGKSVCKHCGKEASVGERYCITCEDLRKL